MFRQSASLLINTRAKENIFVCHAGDKKPSNDEKNLFHATHKEEISWRISLNEFLTRVSFFRVVGFETCSAHLPKAFDKVIDD